MLDYAHLTEKLIRVFYFFNEKMLSWESRPVINFIQCKASNTFMVSFGY